MNSRNLEKEIENLHEQLSELHNVCSSFHRENELLKDMIVKEVTIRKSLQEHNATLNKECKKLRECVYNVQNELTKVCRKEELVRSLQVIVQKIDF